MAKLGVRTCLADTKELSLILSAYLGCYYKGGEWPGPTKWPGRPHTAPRVCASHLVRRWCTATSIHVRGRATVCARRTNFTRPFQHARTPQLPPRARAPTSPRMSSHLDSRLGQSRAHIPFWPDDDPGFSRLINSQDERGADNRDNMRDNCSHPCSQCPPPIPPGFLLLSGAGPPKTFLSSSADTYLGSSF